jgi:hypothetical protein
MKKIVYETEMKEFPKDCDHCECQWTCEAYRTAQDLFSFEEHIEAKGYLWEHCTLREEYTYRRCGWCAGWDWTINLGGVETIAWYCPCCGKLNPNIDEEKEIIPYLSKINEGQII